MSGHLSPQDHAELQSLIQALFDGRISEEDRERLKHWMRENEEASWMYVQYLNLCAGLHWDIAQETPAGDIVEKKTPGTSNSPILGFLGDAFRAGGDILSRSFVLTLLFAIGMPVIILTLLFFDIAHQPIARAPVGLASSSVAKITCTNDAVWGRNHSSLSVGSDLIAGQSVQLLKGLAEITFKDGTKTILESPSTFEIRSADTGYLRVGRLTASVPPAAHGFTIETPLARVIDLGTDFGVSVAPDGTSETHVFKGKVELVASDMPNQPAASKVFLKAGQAAKVPLEVAAKPVRIIRMSAEPRKFVKSIKPSNVHFAHHGEIDPAKEGWGLLVIPGGKGRVSKNTPPIKAPIDDGGTKAWRIRNNGPTEVRYSFSRKEGLSKKIADEAQKKGWVVRARIKVVGVPNKRSICFCMYHTDTQTWGLFPKILPDGTQVLWLEGMSSLGKNATYKIPNSRDRYIDYEIRYYPNAKGAEVFVDGKRIATEFGRPNVMGAQGLLFGLQKASSEARFAEVEWKMLDGGTSGKQVEDK